MNFHPDVLAAHAEFGGDLESMQKLYEYPALKAENERLRLSVSAWEDSARINKARADDAERALAERAGGVSITKDEAQKLCDRLEYDASWDKCGSGYYSMKRQLSAITTEPAAPFGMTTDARGNPMPKRSPWDGGDTFLSKPAAPEGLTPLKPASAGAWRIKKGEPIPQWLEKTENVELTAGCDLIVIEAEDAGFDVYRSDPNSFANMMEGTCPDPNKHATVTGAPTNLHTPSVLESRISKLHAEIAELTRAAPEGQQEAGADAVRFLYKHGALTHIAACEAVELLTSNGFEISRRYK